MELDRREPELPITAPASGAAIVMETHIGHRCGQHTDTDRARCNLGQGRACDNLTTSGVGCIPVNRRHRDVERLSPAGTSEMVRGLPERAVSAGRDSNLLKMICRRAACSKTACTSRGSSVRAPSLTRRWLSRSSALQQQSMVARADALDEISFRRRNDKVAVRAALSLCRYLVPVMGVAPRSR